MLILKARENKMVVSFVGLVVLYQAHDDEARKQLVNAQRFMRDLQDTPFVPKLLACDFNYTIVEYIHSEPVTSREAFTANCAKLLSTLQQRGIVHGDITPPNVLVRDNTPVLIDFDESRYTNEDTPDKRPEGDAVWIGRLVQVMA